MRKVILQMMFSLDGFIDGPNGELDWVPFDEEFQKYVNHEHSSTFDTILFGRVAYQKTGKQDADVLVRLYPGPPQDVIDWVNNLNKMTKIVFSKTLKEVGDNAWIISEDLEEEVNRMKQQPGKDMQLIGGPGLVSTFIRLGLIDEYRIMVAPVILGGGKPLFKGISDKVKLKLLRTKTFASGLVILYYQPA
jgi:dihydrofolate reductase